MKPQTFPFPVISPVSLDYQSKVQYKCEINRMDNNNIIVTHEITDDNIIADLLKSGDAKFGCMVSLPATMYRQLFTDDNKSLNVVQKINYNKAGAHDDIQYPMFRPVIIVTKDINVINPDKTQGFDDIWLGQEIKFPQGGIIGFDEWMKFGDAASSLLRFVKVDDENIQNGMIKVEPDDTGGFRFKVSVHESLFTFMTNSYNKNEKSHVRSICTHALSRGFEILASSYKDNWEQYPNLKLLEQQLKNEEQLCWYEDGFCPETVATYLYPHLPSDDRSGSDES